MSEDKNSSGAQQPPVPSLNPDEDVTTLAKNRKRIAPIDETNLTQEQTTLLEQRRAYNRKCAAKARKRSKDLISTLRIRVEELTNEKAEMERKLEVMRAQMDLLQQQNRSLLISQHQQQQQRQPGTASASSDTVVAAAAAAAFPSVAANPFLFAQSLPNPILEAMANQARLAVAAAPATSVTSFLPPASSVAAPPNTAHPTSIGLPNPSNATAPSPATEQSSETTA